MFELRFCNLDKLSVYFLMEKKIIHVVISFLFFKDIPLFLKKEHCKASKAVVQDITEPSLLKNLLSIQLETNQRPPLSMKEIKQNTSKQTAPSGPRFGGKESR